MQRIIWIGGVACLAQVACIEDRAAEDDGTSTPDAAAPTPDAAMSPVPPAPGSTPAPAPEPDPPPPEPEAMPEPDPPPEPEAMPEPEPDPELPPWVCPPEGRQVFTMGACVAVDAEAPGTTRVEARITAVGEGIPPGPCSADPNEGEVLSIGGPSPDSARWFTAVTPDGRVWQIVLDLPVEVRFAVDEAVVIETDIAPAFFFGYQGTLAISTEEGLQAFVAAGDRGRPDLDDPELVLQPGEQSCYWEEPEEAFCTYTGRRLSAVSPSTGVEQVLSYGQIVDVGPFEVINGGILSIGDRGACNAAPERFRVGAWRRR